jgi:hypothetical protein
MARLQQKKQAAVTTGPADIRHSLRDGLTVSFVLSSVHRAFWPPCRDNALARVALDTSVGVSGPHDFAVRHVTSRLALKRLMP